MPLPKGFIIEEEPTLPPGFVEETAQTPPIEIKTEEVGNLPKGFVLESPVLRGALSPFTEIAQKGLKARTPSSIITGGVIQPLESLGQGLQALAGANQPFRADMQKLGISTPAPLVPAMKGAGETLVKDAETLRKKFGVEPSGLLEEFGQSAAGSLPLMVGMGVGGAGLSGAGLTAKLAQRLAAQGGALFEGVQNAGETRQRVMQKTGDEAEANKAAAQTLVTTVPASAILNNITLFGEAGTAIKRVLQQFFGESGEETLQQVMGNLAAKDPWYDGLIKAAAFGGIMGVGGGQIADAITRKVAERGVPIEKNRATGIEQPRRKQTYEDYVYEQQGKIRPVSKQEFMEAQLGSKERDVVIANDAVRKASIVEQIREKAKTEYLTAEEKALIEKQPPAPTFQPKPTDRPLEQLAKTEEELAKPTVTVENGKINIDLTPQIQAEVKKALEQAGVAKPATPAPSEQVQPIQETPKFEETTPVIEPSNQPPVTGQTEEAMTPGPDLEEQYGLKGIMPQRVPPVEEKSVQTSDTDQQQNVLDKIKLINENTDRLINEGGYQKAAVQPRSKMGESALFQKGYRPLLWNEKTNKLEQNTLGVWVKEKKKTGVFQPKQEQDDFLVNGEPRFREAKSPTFNPQSTKTKVAQLNKEIFGDDRVNFVERILENPEAVAKYENTWMTFMESRSDEEIQDDFWHEGAHRYFDQFATDEERFIVYKELKRKTQFRSKDSIGKEEHIAELFSRYKRRQRFKAGHQTFSSKVWEAIGKVLDRIQRYLTNRKKLRDIFDDISRGEAKNRTSRFETKGKAPISEGLSSETSPKTVSSTPEFKRWFGDSKVVDENGKPLVVYHGTQKDIYQFDNTKNTRRNTQIAGETATNKSFWFAENRAVTEFFANGGVRSPQGALYPGAKIMSVYLSIQDPLIVDMYDFKNIPIISETKRKAMRSAKEGRVEGDGGAFELNKDIYNIGEIKEQMTRRAQKEGKDGIIFKNGYDFRAFDGDIYAVFSPTQIKSATGNVGTFDPNNPDIRYRIPKGTPDPYKDRNETLSKIRKIIEQRGLSAEAIGKGIMAISDQPDFRKLNDDQLKLLYSYLKYAQPKVVEKPKTAEEVKVAEMEQAVRGMTTPLKDKVNAIDYIRTPEKVMEKIGLADEMKLLREGWDKYLKELPKNIDKITAWSKRVSKESNEKIFRNLDGENIILNDEENKVAIEIREWLQEWAQRLKLPPARRISTYITHIFDDEQIQKEFDEELAKIIDPQLAKSVYNPFLLKRIGAPGYIRDTWLALDAYVKRGTRKVHVDPALEEIGKKSKNLELSQWKYVKKYVDRVNMRPTEFDSLIDNGIKQVVGYRFGQRPVARISRILRAFTYRAKLGLNVSSALRNLSQGANNYAKLGEKYTIIGYTKLLSKANTQELIEEGVFNQGFVQDRTLSATKKALEKFDKVLFFLFETAEHINRGAAYFGGKAKALAQGKTEQEAKEYGKKIVRETQFLFSQIDTPVFLQNDLLKTMTQFQTYNTKQIEFLTDMLKKKEYVGLIRYGAAGLLFVMTLGQIFGMEPEDLLPALQLGWVPPSLKFPAEVVKAAINTRDKYGNERDTARKIGDVTKEALGILPGSSQIFKSAGMAGAMAESGRVRSRSGKRVNFRIDTSSPFNVAKGYLFGKYQTKEGQEYLKNRHKKKYPTSPFRPK